MASMRLNDVTVLVTTFMRPGFLDRTLHDLAVCLPDCAVVVACDDEITPRNWNVKWAQLPFDSGLTAKRNAAVSLTSTKYALLASDDYNFAPIAARWGIEKMVETLDAHPEVDVVVGTYNGKEYEGTLEYKPGEYIKEHRLRDSVEPIFDQPHPAWKIDLGINYFLARTQVLHEVPWDENIRPIGGEHGDWFLSMKEAGKTVVFVPGCNISALTEPEDKRWAHMNYMKFRCRAMQGHEIFLKKRNVKNYYGFDEVVR